MVAALPFKMDLSIRPPPLNQEALYNSSSSDEEEEEEDDEEQQEKSLPTDTSFQAWFLDQRNVHPDTSIVYIMMITPTS